MTQRKIDWSRPIEPANPKYRKKYTVSYVGKGSKRHYVEWLPREGVRVCAMHGQADDYGRGCGAPFDIRNVPETVTMYENLWRGRITWMLQGHLYESKADAESAARYPSRLKRDYIHIAKPREVEL